MIVEDRDTYQLLIAEFRYSVKRDEYDYDEREIHYEPSDKQLLTALADIVVSNIKGVKDCDYKQELEIARQMIEDNDLQDFLIERYKEELKDYFREDAEQEAKDLWR